MTSDTIVTVTAQICKILCCVIISITMNDFKQAMNPAVGKLPDGSQMLGATAVQPIAIQQPMGVRQQIPATIPGTPSQAETKVLDKRRLQELVKEIDPMEQLDEDVEEVIN